MTVPQQTGRNHLLMAVMIIGIILLFNASYLGHIVKQTKWFDKTITIKGFSKLLLFTLPIFLLWECMACRPLKKQSEPS